MVPLFTLLDSLMGCWYRRFLFFCLGCHHLRIHTGRWHPPVLLCPQRTCLLSVVPQPWIMMLSASSLVNTLQLLPRLEICSCHMLHHLWPVSSLRYAFGHCLPLAWFFLALVKHVAVCVRVCRYCHQYGGTAVVGLPPDVFLAEGQYLITIETSWPLKGGARTEPT